jgi:hypothetical protein
MGLKTVCILLKLLNIICLCSCWLVAEVSAAMYELGKRTVFSGSTSECNVFLYSVVYDNGGKK